MTSSRPACTFGSETFFNVSVVCRDNSNVLFEQMFCFWSLASHCDRCHVMKLLEDNGFYKTL